MSRTRPRPMSYVDRHLLRHERVLYRARLSRAVFAWPAGLLLVALGLPLVAGATPGLSALLALIAAGYAAAAWMRYAGSEFAVTDQRVIMKVGMLRRRCLELMLDRVEGLMVEQDVFGRLLDFGSVSIIGTGGTREPFQQIADPLGLRRALQQQIARHRNAGPHQPRAAA